MTTKYIKSITLNIVIFFIFQSTFADSLIYPKKKPILTYEVLGGSDITASINGSSINFTASANFNGSESFTASVSDGVLTSSQNFTVTVTPVNDAPVLEEVSEVIFYEDGSRIKTL